MHFNILALVASLLPYLICHLSICNYEKLKEVDRTMRDIEIDLNITQIIQHQGFIVEEHYVTTEDGYILCLLRVPPKLKPLNASKSSKIVLLQHGLLDSSHTWFINLRNQSLGFILADRGYDVWISNSRGSTYSEKHATISTESDEFWQFTWSDMAKYDLPAIIKYILRVTGSDKISYVAHSQGTQMAFACFNQDTKLQSHVNIFIALAPVVFQTHTKCFIRYVIPYSEMLGKLLSWLHWRRFMPVSSVIRYLGEHFCGPGRFPYICSKVVYSVAGQSVETLNQTRLPVYFAHTPAGSSFKNVQHHFQGMQVQKFQQFDYGPFWNTIYYHQLSPPEYPLSNLKIPLVMYHGGNDLLATSDDVQLLVNRTSYAIKSIEYLPTYNHLDFVWSIDAHRVLYPSVLKHLESV